MKDDISKRKGLPFSTSRSQEKANKRNTKKARRQNGRKLCDPVMRNETPNSNTKLTDQRKETKS